MSDVSEHPMWMPAEARGEATIRARLAGRRIAVVGAGTQSIEETDPPPGNGQAIAIQCAREGAFVACIDRVESAAADTRRKITELGGKAVALVADVANAESC